MALEYTYVFQLPASVVLEISNVLDPSNTWEEIGMLICILHIKLFF